MDYKKLYEEQKKKYEKLEEWNNIVRKAHQGIAEENNMLIEGKIKLSEKFWEKEIRKLKEENKKLKEANSKKKYMNMDSRCGNIQGIELNLNNALQGWYDCNDEDIHTYDFEEGGKEVMFYKELCGAMVDRLKYSIEISHMIWEETCELMKNYEENGWVKVLREEQPLELE